LLYSREKSESDKEEETRTSQNPREGSTSTSGLALLKLISKPLA
jgi:hypothetical protein